MNLPPVIGHRGAAAHAPENTLAGFCKARELGCEWIEFDVRLTADGALVVCHDDTLDRTTNGSGRVSTLPLVAIRELDAGGWFGPVFAGELVPTLDEALSCCGELGLGANIEIKAERGCGPATAAAVVRCLDGRAGCLSPVLISSFLADAVAEAATQMPSLPRGILWGKVPRGWRRTADRLGCTTIHCRQADVSQSLVAETTAAGYPLLAYTVNDAAQARRLFGWGIASVFSDAPDIIAGAAAEALAAARRGATL